MPRVRDKGPRCAGRRLEPAVTHAQHRALVQLHRFIARKGYPPTVAELADRLDITPPSALQLLRQLERKRIISRASGKARAMRILKRGRDIVGT